MNVRFTPFNGARDWDWVRVHVPVIQCADTSGIVAVDEDTGERVAACLMDNWTHTSIQGHFVVTNPIALRHGFFEYCADYVFNVAGMHRVYAMVPADNAKAMKLNAHLGFTVKARLDDGYDVGVDLLLMEMKRENCRFIEHSEAA